MTAMLAVLAVVLVPLAVALAALFAAVFVVDGWRTRRTLARFDARLADPEPGAELVPVAVSTLPVPDPDGWSSQVGWSAWRAWLDARHTAVFTAEPAIFAALAERYLTEPQRELPAAPKRRTRRPKTTIGATS